MFGRCRWKEGLPYGNSHRSAHTSAPTSIWQGLLFILLINFFGSWSRHFPIAANQLPVISPRVCFLCGNALELTVSAYCAQISCALNSVKARTASTPIIKRLGLGWLRTFIADYLPLIGCGLVIIGHYLKVRVTFSQSQQQIRFGLKRAVDFYWIISLWEVISSPFFSLEWNPCVHCSLDYL